MKEFNLKLFQVGKFSSKIFSKQKKFSSNSVHCNETKNCVLCISLVSVRFGRVCNKASRFDG